jgi:hopene-associated glycosyltransferase HpnB
VAGTALLTGLAVTGALSLAAWFAALLDPARPWDLRPVGEDDRPPDPARHATVAVVVPARNEAALLPHTLPALLGQDYEGAWQVILVDDRSTDGTGAVACRIGGERLTVVAGGPLPGSWVGKVWALEQGIAAAGSPDFLLLTDADIVHAPGSLRALVADAETRDLDLTSRMARLHCRTVAEKLVIPPFLFFFNVLYPMRRVADPRSETAAAAGGCVLVRRSALDAAGGFQALRGEIIDDVNLARAVKHTGGRIRLAVSRSDVVSIREHSLASAWRMVRRTAFDELRYSWLRLAGALAGLLLLFAVPPCLVGLALAGIGPGGWRIAFGALGGSAWLISATTYLPTLRLFELRPLWALALPTAGLLYGGMTLDSAVRHALSRGRHRGW